MLFEGLRGLCFRIAAVDVVQAVVQADIGFGQRGGLLGRGDDAQHRRARVLEVPLRRDVPHVPGERCVDRVIDDLVDLVDPGRGGDLLDRVKATELLGTMLGGFNVQPLIDLLDDRFTRYTAMQCLSPLIDEPKARKMASSFLRRWLTKNVPKSPVSGPAPRSKMTSAGFSRR
mgnify:CR=1 FL=1